MLFSSMVFLWIFLPITFVLNYFLKPKQQNILLLVASLIFYAWGEPRYVFLMLFSILINWTSGMLLSKYKAYKKLVLIGCILINLGLLGYFKYLGLFIRTWNHLIGKETVSLPEIALPIGISFFTFQALSYVIDVYRGDCEVQKNICNLALYISFFPQLIAGPIVKYRDINEQIENRTITRDKLADGMRRFTYGLAKKVLISNILAQSVDLIYALSNEEITGVMIWVASILYTFQIYYDFSGYSDMAIGLGKMFGFEFLENFNYPYISLSIQEFWRRWHISLSTWFREYVYIPLGGNRKGTMRTYLNLCIVFFLTGIWHGASYNFILWGMYHGFFSILERLGLGKILKKNKGIAFVYTFLVVNFGWVMFRIESLKQIIVYFSKMCMPWKMSMTHYSIWEFVTPHTLIILIFAILGMGFMQQITKGKEISSRWYLSVAEILYCMALLILCISALASNTYNPFIYFRF